MRLLFTMILLLGFALAAAASEIHPPRLVTAGSAITIPTSGSGDATFYLVGPALVSKSNVQAGSNIQVDADQTEHAGRYTAVLCASDGCTAAEFFVGAAAANKISFLVHPSRIPVGTPDGISAVAFIRDNFENMVVKPEPVTFSIMPKSQKAISAQRTSENGVAWVRLTSAKKSGATKLGASIGHADEIRVVQQVAADACNLRIKASRAKQGFLIETDPVHDCSGNPVPDGTIVSFTANDSVGKTTVDVPIKRGIAKIEMPIDGHAKVTVASGVVTGNELEVANQ
ncbi:MAG TPA: hypothetical protein VJO35_16530 [Terriglobales bacterium]|nr:hypothetical protein [Terriglobales bacterium]